MVISIFGQNSLCLNFSSLVVAMVDTQSRAYQQNEHILMLSLVYPPRYQLFVTLMFPGDLFTLNRFNFFFEPRKILVSSVYCDDELCSVT